MVCSFLDTYGNSLLMELTSKTRYQWNAPLKLLISTLHADFWSSKTVMKLDMSIRCSKGKSRLCWGTHATTNRGKVRKHICMEKALFKNICWPFLLKKMCILELDQQMGFRTHTILVSSLHSHLCFTILVSNIVWPFFQ